MQPDIITSTCGCVAASLIGYTLGIALYVLVSWSPVSVVQGRRQP